MYLLSFIHLPNSMAVVLIKSN